MTEVELNVPGIVGRITGELFSPRFIVSLIIGFSVCFFVSLFPSAWMLMFVAGAIAGLIAGSWLKGFLSGAISGGLTWGFLVLYYILSTNSLTMMGQFLGIVGNSLLGSPDPLASLGILIPILTIVIGLWLAGIGGLVGGAIYYILATGYSIIQSGTETT